MKNSDNTLALLVATFAASAMPLSAELVAGWDTWNSPTNPTASRLAPNVTGTAVTTTEGLAWNIIDGRGASSDGDWGSVVTDPPASTTGGDGVQNENLELSNATTGGTVTFTITNNGETDIVLASFNFDAYAFRPKAARAYELSVLEGGGITAGVIYTSADDEIKSVAGAWNNLAHDDIDHSLTGLEDHTLAPGESVDFLLAFSSGFGDLSGGHDLWLDNVAVFSTTEEQPPAITDVKITKSGNDVTLEFTSETTVDIYRSIDLQTWSFHADGEESPFLDNVGTNPVFFYVLVPVGTTFP